MKLYTFVFKDAFKILKKYKFLFLAGIILSLLGNGGEYEILLRNISILKLPISKNLFLKIININGIFSFQFLNILIKYLKIFNIKLTNNIVFWISSIILIFIALYIQAVIIYIISKIYKNEKFSLKEILLKVKTKIKAIILIHFFFFVLNLTFLSIIGFPIFLILGLGFNVSFDILLKLLIILILTPLLILSSFITKFAISYLLIYNFSCSKAIIYGIELFKKNLLISLETAIFLFLISIILAISDILLVTFLIYPFIISFTLIKTIIPLQKFYLIHFLSTSIIFFLIISPFLSIFQHIIWIILFMKISKQSYKAKILRIFNKNPVDKLWKKI